MTRRIFYSFHYDEDSWRASQIRNIRDIDGNKPAHDNDWESIKRGGNIAIERWVKQQMEGRSCVAVLIGSHTACRKWIKYEICEGWETGKGVFGVYIHGLQNRYGRTTDKGANPFDFLKLGGRASYSIVRCYDPTVCGDSKATYRNIADHMESWIEEAIAIRNRN